MKATKKRAGTQMELDRPRPKGFGSKLVAGMAALAFLAGCGGGDDSTEPIRTTATALLGFEDGRLVDPTPEGLDRATCRDIVNGFLMADTERNRNTFDFCYKASQDFEYWLSYGSRDAFLVDEHPNSTQTEVIEARGAYDDTPSSSGGTDSSTSGASNPSVGTEPSQDDECGTVVLEPNSDFGIFDLTVVGLSCDEASNELTEWISLRAQDQSLDSPAGWSCDAEDLDSAMPLTRYECTRGDQALEFTL